MGGLSIWHWLIIAAIVLVIFGGGGKLSSLLGDAGKGMKAFKDGLKDDPEADKKEPKKVDDGPTP
jgi:sec-independent protein translocase protein TatA